MCSCEKSIQLPLPPHLQFVSCATIKSNENRKKDGLGMRSELAWKWDWEGDWNGMRLEYYLHTWMALSTTLCAIWGATTFIIAISLRAAWKNKKRQSFLPLISLQDPPCNLRLSNRLSFQLAKYLISQLCRRDCFQNHTTLTWLSY